MNDAYIGEMMDEWTIPVDGEEIYLTDDFVYVNEARAMLAEAMKKQRESVINAFIITNMLGGMNDREYVEDLYKAELNAMRHAEVKP